jgi:hypothetical protein
MIDVGVALTWVAMSAASLKGLSVFRRVSAAGCAKADLALLEGDLAHDEFYPVEVLPQPAGGPW